MSYWIQQPSDTAGQEKMWPFNTGDCLIEVTTWEGFTVTIKYTFAIYCICLFGLISQVSSKYKSLIKGFSWLSWSHLLEIFTVATMTWLTVMEYLCHKGQRIYFTCRKHFPILSSFMIYQQVSSTFDNSNYCIRRVYRYQRGNQNS
jgi:hypothetical protein